MKMSFAKPVLIVYRVYLLIFIIVLASCQKELSYETPARPGGQNPPADSLAIFSFVPSGGSCSDAVLLGKVEKGALVTSAQLNFLVNVTKKGKWFITTDVVNGYSFSGAGEFTAAGIQSITLYGAGTPVASGVNQFPLKSTNETCNVSVTVTEGGDTAPAGDYYYKATIDGVAYIQYATYDNGYIPGSGLNGTDDVDFSASIDYINDIEPPGTTGFFVSKGVMHNYLTASDAAFKAFFPVGDIAYAPAGPLRGDGIIIGWKDENGAYWTTTSGTGDQTGSSFKILGVKDGYDLTGTYYIEVKMEFECKLYNENTGEEKKLTKGEMTGIFGKI